MRLQSKTLLFVALGFVLSGASSLQAGETLTCETRKFEAVSDYIDCFNDVQEDALSDGISMKEKQKKIASCATRLEKDFKKAIKHGHKEKACTKPVDISALRMSLDSALLAAFQDSTLNASMACNPADNDDATTRCVYTTSQAVSIDGLMGAIALDKADPEKVMITLEVYAAPGRRGNSGGYPPGDAGKRGYASTTWSWQEFKNRGSYIYLYVGQRAGCGACGGASSMVTLAELTDISDPKNTSDMLAMAGGGGGSGSGKDTHYGHDGGDGGVAQATNADTAHAAGGDGSGGDSSADGGDGLGQGGAKSPAGCDNARVGANGIGGFGGVKHKNSDNDRAGWKSSGIDYSDWSAGHGGNSESGSGPSGGSGGGGYGGGGGACNSGGGGGGGSWVLGYNGQSGTLPDSCGPGSMPNEEGVCDEGGDNGVIVLNIRVND